jgi:ABC-2 type transport system ATP-binding protein
MKQDLLKREVILDAYNRLDLTNELISMGLSYRIEDHVIVPYQDRTAQEIIARLTTKLSHLKMQEPTLEDAYVEYLLRTGGNIA